MNYFSDVLSANAGMPHLVRVSVPTNSDSAPDIMCYRQISHNGCERPQMGGNMTLVIKMVYEMYGYP